MTFLLRLVTSRTATKVVALLAALAVSLSASQVARADHYSTDLLPNLLGAHDIAVTAWSGYLNHCQTIYYYGYTGSERPAYRSAYAFATVNGCDVHFNLDKADNYKWKWFCSVMVHEVGHSAGMEHNNADKRDIMNGPGEIYWRACLRTKQAKKMRKRGKIIDYSIDSWAYYAKPSVSLGGESHDIGHALSAGDLDSHLIAGLPVR
jgi:hypothetical protein